MPDLQELKLKIKNYEKKFRHPKLEQFNESGLYDLFPPDNEKSSDVEAKWPDKWPHLNDAGIYAFLSKDLEVLYIGKASMNHGIGYRLSNYCSYEEGTKKCKLNDTWDGKPRYVYTVAVPSGSKFEAPALEEYLIGEIKTSNNKAGTKSID